jgi:hypothetical protein
MLHNADHERRAVAILATRLVQILVIRTVQACEVATREEELEALRP